MKIAMRDDEIFIKDMTESQFAIIKSWGKLKWDRKNKMLCGSCEYELLNKLASIVNLPENIETERQRLNRVQTKVDQIRQEESVVPIIKPPVKANLFKHQIRGYNMALVVFGAVEV